MIQMMAVLQGLITNSSLAADDLLFLYYSSIRQHHHRHPPLIATLSSYAWGSFVQLMQLQ